MYKATFTSVHPKFKLNGHSSTKEELYQIAYSLIKEGANFEKDFAEFILNWFDNNSFVEVQTSGTTGKPKLIKIEKQAMINSALATGVFFDLNSGDSTLCCLPVKYIAGKMMLVRAFVLGLELDFVEAKSNPLKNLEKTYDFAAMVPLQVENSINELYKVKKLIIGGAKINAKLSEILKNTSCIAYETYSMTETVTHIAAKKIEDKAFKLLPNITISKDERGCLVVSALRINSNQITTNDVVDLISEDEFIWLGRIDNVVNSGGIKLFPEQIEEKLVGKINQRYFFAGMPDDSLGEKLILVVEGNESNRLNISLFDELDKFERPKAIFYVENFKETETGKIKRKEILSMILK